jgi:DNA-nicking Smr family endonuclease
MGGRQSKQFDGQQSERQSQATAVSHETYLGTVDELADWDTTVSRVRALEHKLYDKKQELFEASKRAYRNGNGAEAKRLSVAAHRADAEYRKAREIAGSEIYRLRNSRLPRSTLDLHGQYVEEALSLTENRLRELKRKGHLDGSTSLLVITGAGHHSRAGRAKIRPAVEELLGKADLDYEEDGPGAFRIQVEKTSRVGRFIKRILRLCGVRD